MTAEEGSRKEAVSKLTYGAGFQPFYLLSIYSWGVARG